jgi:threonine/homoserine/homoserine lactone efflux protein
VFEDRDGEVGATARSAALILLGVTFVVLAAGTWRRRPRDGQPPQMPNWLATVDRLNARRAAWLGLVVAVLNPKNLVILPVAGSTIAQSGLTRTGQATAVLVFACVAALTVVIPVFAYTIAKPSVAGPLEGMRGWLLRSSHAVIACLASVIAALLLARGISELL